MYILEVSYGCPSLKYPQNGVFQMDQAIALRDSGHKVIFVALDMRSMRRWRKWGFSRYTHAGMPVYEFSLPIGPMLPGLRDRCCSYGFEHLLRRIVRKFGKPDIVHVHFGDTAQAVVSACGKRDIPYVVTEHSSGVNRDDLTEAEIEPVRHVYQNAAAVIAVSGPLARRIERYSGIKPIVIPNIIDFSTFRAAREAHEVFRFVSAGNLIVRKGFDVLLKAFKKISDGGVRAELIIMGDGTERDALERQKKDLGLGDCVRFTGAYKRSEFSEALSKADAFVLASRRETFGVVYAEAMACGVPVIATRCGGPEDFVDATNGIMVDVDDAEDLADAMIRMYGHADKFNPNQIAAATQNNFSAQAVAKKIERVLQGAIRQEMRN